MYPAIEQCLPRKVETTSKHSDMNVAKSRAKLVMLECLKYQDETSRIFVKQVASIDANSMPKLKSVSKIDCIDRSKAQSTFWTPSSLIGSSV